MKTSNPLLQSRVAKAFAEMDAKTQKAYITAGTLALTAISSTSMIFASNPFQSIAEAIAGLFKQFYDAAMGLVTVIAIILIFICLLLRMFSKDPRKVESATDWMKRIIITWVVILFLGNIQEIFNGISGSDVNLEYSGGGGGAAVE